MGYRGSRAQLEARFSVLGEELAALEHRILHASARVDVLRQAQWGRLGVAWFRFKLRRALRGIDHRAQHGGSDASLKLAIRRREKVHGQSQEVLRWLEEELASRTEHEDPEPDGRLRNRRRDTESGAIVPTWVKEGLALIGASMRILAPVLMVVFFVLSSFGDGDGDVEVEDWEPSPQRPGEEQFASDVILGSMALAFLALGGGAVWWWVS